MRDAPVRTRRGAQPANWRPSHRTSTQLLEHDRECEVRLRIHGLTRRIEGRMDCADEHGLTERTGRSCGLLITSIVADHRQDFRTAVALDEGSASLEVNRPQPDRSVALGYDGSVADTIRTLRWRERITAARGERRRVAPYLLLSLAVLLADQLTKAAVRARLAEGEVWPSRDALIAISHVENPGAAFGILQGAGSFLLGAAAVGVGGVLVYLLVFPPAQRLYVAALSLILGGAIGNLIDRIAKGTVTDFIDPMYYPSFNIADSAIVCGVIAVVFLTFKEEARR